MQLKNADSWAVVKDGEVLYLSERREPAAYIAASGPPGRTVVPCRLVPVADLPVWRPIAEAPRDGTWVLAHDATEHGSEIATWHGDWVDRCGDVIHPTHYMPLPAPPEDQ